MTQKSSCRSRFLRVPMAMQYRRPKHLPGHMFHDYYHRLLGVCNDAAGIIERLCEASAAYCMRLHRQSLEETVMPIAPPERRAYRAEVRHWMAVEEIDSVEDAAKRLGLSLSALKSIMSDRGYRRYGDATLSRVLERIGYKGEHPHRSPVSPPDLIRRN